MPAQYVYAPMEIDHIHPASKGGTDDEENLWLACPRCNLAKRDQTSVIDPETNQDTSLYNPRLEIWHEHFRWSEDSLEIIGRTLIGKGRIIALQLNHETRIAFRKILLSAGWHPPQE